MYRNQCRRSILSTQNKSIVHNKIYTTTHIILSGGIKLGAGGLIRAYGSAARLVLRSSPTEIYIPKSTIRLSTRTANSGAVYAAAAKFGGVTSGETYNDRGELEVCVFCDEVDGERLKEEIVDATRGGVMFL